MAQHLPRFYRTQQHFDDLKKISAILVETGFSLEDLGEERGKPFGSARPLTVTIPLV
jgi:hypothetical protein